MLISAHAGFPRWLHSGADFIELDIRRDGGGRVVIAHDEVQPGDKHATYDEVLGAMNGSIGLHLDLKEAGFEVDLVTRALERVPPNRLVVTPDFTESGRVIKERFPQIRVSPIDFVTVDQRYIGDARQGLPIWVWTVDDRKLMRRLMADPRIECIVTNRPDVALKLRRARS